jgi:outer membrane protein insertion porin family
MVVDEGDPYSALLINKSINKLKARGIFGKVEKKITEGSSPGLKVLEISVEETATGEMAAGAGVGTDGTSFMFAVSENNWLGKGIELRSSLDLTAETISGSIAIRNPNYQYTGNSLFTSLDISSTDRTVTSGYESSKTGFTLGTEFEQYEDIFLSPSISAAYEVIDVESTASDAIKKMDGNFTNLDFRYGITSDKRNQIFKPTAGHRTQFIQSLPIVRDSSSFLNGLDVSAYRTLSEDVIGSIKFYGRSIHGVDNDDVRLTSRLFLPQRRLRGFNVRRTGPKDDSDYIGGNYAAALGFEAQLPNLLPESTRTDVSVFLDSGNVSSIVSL